MVSFTVESPLYINVGKKRYSLNLNVYRNTHYQTLGIMKKKYAELMLPRLSHLPKFDKVKITYTLHHGSNRKSDVMNWISVVDKFFQDVLVQAGKLEEDNYTYVPIVVGTFGSVDRSNPRMEITIQEL